MNNKHIRFTNIVYLRSPSDNLELDLHQIVLDLTQKILLFFNIFLLILTANYIRVSL